MTDFRRLKLGVDLGCKTIILASKNFTACQTSLGLSAKVQGPLMALVDGRPTVGVCFWPQLEYGPYRLQNPSTENITLSSNLPNSGLLQGPRGPFLLGTKFLEVQKGTLGIRNHTRDP